MILISSLTLSQTTNTKNCLNAYQIDQIYKSLKQGEYLKERLRETEDVLKNANAGLELRAERIKKLEELNAKRVAMYHTLEFECETSKKIDSLEISRQQLIIDDFPNQMKMVENKGFWKGAKTGTVVGIGAAIIGMLIIK